jgi:hypothetical protein
MNIRDYIRSQITLEKQASLEMIYQELMNSGHHPTEIFQTINEVVAENINKALEDYLKKKNE